MIYAKEPTKHNKSNCTQILQPIYKHQNWSANMVNNHNRHRKENQY